LSPELSLFAPARRRDWRPRRLSPFKRACRATGIRIQTINGCSAGWPSCLLSRIDLSIPNSAAALEQGLLRRRGGPWQTFVYQASVSQEREHASWRSAQLPREYGGVPADRTLGWQSSNDSRSTWTCSIGTLRPATAKSIEPPSHQQKANLCSQHTDDVGFHRVNAVFTVKGRSEIYSVLKATMSSKCRTAN
jgi:hypothetical protein